MPIFSNPAVMREVIMDHYRHPRFKMTPADPGAYLQIPMDSPNCIDDIIVYLSLENNIIKEVYFDGVACAIATASTDIMCEMMEGKSREEAEYLIGEYKKMMFEEEFNHDALGEALVFINTAHQPARIKCATIGWDALEKALEEN